MNTEVFKIMSPVQIRSIFEAENTRIALWTGAVSAGKTIASTLAFVMALVKAPGTGLIIITGRTIQTIERNIIDVLMNPVGPFGPFAKFIHHTRGSNTAVMFGRVVHLIGASDLRAEGRLRGSTVVLALADEITLLPEGFFTMLLSRLRVPGARLIGTSNPDAPTHWLRKNFMLRANEPDMNLKHWHFRIEDNPSLTEEYIRSIKAEYTGVFYRRFILGEWCMAEGAIFDAWDEELNVVDELPPIRIWLSAGVDYGTRNAFAAELVGLGVDGRLYVASEYYWDSQVKRRQLTDFEYAQAIVEWLQAAPETPKYTIVDPSALSFRLALQQAGVQSTPGNNDVMDGIRTVGSLIATRRLLVHRSCLALVEQLPSYSWDPKAAERGEDAPVKLEDHAIDAARYALHTTQALWRNRICAPAPVTEPLAA